MYTLAINTASSRTALVLARDQQIVAERSWKSENDEAEKIMPTIREMLGEISFEQINRVLVLRGPGSFTGLRVGITVANTISYLVGAKLFQISTFEYWHRLSSLPILVFAGRNSVYLSLGPKDYRIVELDDLNQELAKLGIDKVSGDISEEQKAVLEADFVPADGGLADTLTLGEPVKAVSPLYVRQPGITISKKNQTVGAQS